MNKFTKHTGKCVPLFQPNIDTDQIVPKKFLLRIERTGFDEALFYEWRFDADGAPKADFVLNDAKYAGATVLLAGANFGCGSSREHAPWALAEYGFRAIIAPSFADIFYNNCFKIGLLPIALDEQIVKEFVRQTEQSNEFHLTIDLENQSISDGEKTIDFAIDDFRRYCLLNGLDDIELTLLNEGKISDYESKRARFAF